METFYFTSKLRLEERKHSILTLQAFNLTICFIALYFTDYPACGVNSAQSNVTSHFAVQHHIITAQKKVDQSNFYK